MIVLSVLLSILATTQAGPATEVSHKGQFCTDPRTMRKHAAYTEWADAYSCTRHRCQPGGRNLAIYTVGCKRVEAPESAIECEEVVEDTNMQFPYCCTRLRCLVVVRGEVWTRVLGQPWETLPAAPWSHMYKMKKPPPADGTFLPKTEEGPVYELQTETDRTDPVANNAEGEEKVLRSGKKGAEGLEYADAVNRAAPAQPPDIVIALSTSADKEKEAPRKKEESSRHKRGRLQNVQNAVTNYFEDDIPEVHPEEPEETEKVTEKEKPPLEPLASEERYYGNSYAIPTQKPIKAQYRQMSWTEIPQSQWNVHDQAAEPDPATARNNWMDHEPEALHLPPETPVLRANPEPQANWPEFPAEEKKDEKPANLQALVDAIGTRMRDIESVVARMSEKVHPPKPAPAPEVEAQALVIPEKNPLPPNQFRADTEHKHHDGKEKDHSMMKKPSPDGDNYKRFTSHSHGGSKYVRAGGGDVTTEPPLFVEDTSLNGYYSDASNSLLKRAPKEPAATYMAPVDSRRKSTQSGSEEVKHKKKQHKKKKSKSHHKKHHNKEDKRRKFRLNSVELDKNVVSLEESNSAPAAGVK